ncbi:MAG: DUF2282 domain-containing protein [Pseudomonadota bacterium]
MKKPDAMMQASEGNPGLEKSADSVNAVKPMATMNTAHLRNMLAGVLALGLAGLSQEALAAKGEMEKCYSIVKAEKNDCSGVNNSCVGTNKVDAAVDGWIYLPKGSCEKIIGASLESGNDNVAATPPACAPPLAAKAKKPSK